MASVKGPLIEAIAGITAVANAGATVHPNRAPQGTTQLPYIVVKLETKDRNQDLSGISDTLINDEFDIVVFADNSTEAEAIGAAIPEGLEALEDTTITDANDLNGRILQAVYLIDEDDDCEPIGDGSDYMLHSYSLTIQIQHSPPAA